MPTSLSEAELVFVLPQFRRREILWVLSLSSALLPVAAGHYLGPTAFALALGVAAALGWWLYTWYRNGGVTAVGPQGITTRPGALPARTTPWHEVTSIDVDTRPTTRWGDIRTLRVRREHGRTLRVPVLVDASYAPDPDFEDKCEQIVDCWERYA